MPNPDFDRRRVGTYLGLGFGLAATTGLFMALGVLLDRHAGTAPLFTLLGAFVGGALGFYNLYRQAKAAEKDDDEDEGKP